MDDASELTPSLATCSGPSEPRGSASAAPAQSPAGNSTNDEHLAAAWGYPALPKGVLSYKDADVALLHHAKNSSRSSCSSCRRRSVS